MPLQFSDVFPLKSARYHEVTGSGAYAFAAISCGSANGNIIWFVEDWLPETINPIGLEPYCDPHRLLIGKCKNNADVLAASEDALRSGSVSMVVSELTKPLSLTAGRRLQLAAEVGASTGLMIIPEDMGSNATQTRWQVSPVYTPSDSTHMRWSLSKNKSGTNGEWTIGWDDKTRTIFVVPESAQRTADAQAAY